MVHCICPCMGKLFTTDTFIETYSNINFLKLTIMKSKITNTWTYFYNVKSSIPTNKVTGKYLFFYSNKKLLISLGKILMKKFDLPLMKVPTSNTPNDSPGFEFVLAVYDTSNHQMHDINRFLWDNEEYANINYRYFKTNKATQEGSYSEEFKRSQAHVK